MPVTNKIHFVGQLQRPNERPENIELFVDERPNDLPVKYKTADTERSSNDTLTDDPHLFGWILQAASFYKVTGYIQVNAASSTPDYKHRFQFSQTPVDTTITYISVDTVGLVEADTEQMTTTIVQPAATNTRGIQFHAFIDTHATLASIMNYQWAQNVADAGATTLHAGSWIKIERMGVS